MSKPERVIRFNIDFFEVECSGPSSFEQAIDRIQAKQVAARNVQRRDSVFRLQRLFKARDFREGDFVRLRMDELPAKGHILGAEEMIPLLDQEGLCSHTAFVFHIPSKTLVLQRNGRGFGPERVIEYLRDKAEAEISLTPKIKGSALARLAALKWIRTVHVKVGSLKNVGKLAEQHLATRDVLRAARRLEAPKLDILFTVGLERRQSLNVDETRKSVKSWLRLARDSSASVTTLEISGSDEDGASERFDLLLDRIIAKGEAPRTADFDMFSRARIQALRRAWEEWKSEV